VLKPYPALFDQLTNLTQPPQQIGVKTTVILEPVRLTYRRPQNSHHVLNAPFLIITLSYLAHVHFRHLRADFIFG
jgi:hypothetical protein